MTAGEGIRVVGRINGGPSPEDNAEDARGSCTIAGGCWGSTARRMMRYSPDGNPSSNTESRPRVPRSIVMLGCSGKLIVGVGWCPSSSGKPSMGGPGVGSVSAEIHAPMVIGAVYEGPGNALIKAVMISRSSSRARACCKIGGFPMMAPLSICHFRAQTSLQSLYTCRSSSLPVNSCHASKACHGPKDRYASHPKWRRMSRPTGVNTLGYGSVSHSSIVARMRAASPY